MILTVWSERATERKFQGAKWPGNERARERVGQGANRPESYWPIRSGERIGPGAKRLGTLLVYAYILLTDGYGSPRIDYWLCVRSHAHWSRWTAVQSILAVCTVVAPAVASHA